MVIRLCALLAIKYMYCKMKDIKTLLYEANINESKNEITKDNHK